IVARTGFSSLLEVFRLIPRGDQDRRNELQLRILSGQSNELEATHPRHLDVDQEDAITLRSRLLEPLLSGRRELDLVPRRLENALLEHAGRERVIDDKDRQARRRSFE